MATKNIIFTESNLIGTLQASLDTTATSITVKFKDAVTGEARTPESTTLVFVIDKGQQGLPNENYEIIECSSHSTTSNVTTLTITKRGCTFNDKVLTAGTGKAHAAGAEIGVADVHVFINHIGTLCNGEYEFPNALKLLSTAVPIFDSDPTISDDKHVCTKKYADDLAIAGTPDASTTVKGVSEEATDAELGAGTGAGGTSARLFAGGASHTATPTANKVPVANASGVLADGWLGLTTESDTLYSDGTDLQRLAKGTSNQYYKMNSGATAPEWGGDNLDEANTFFGATDITGAEAETLTDGSDADSLHTHDSFTTASYKTGSWTGQTVSSGGTITLATIALGSTPVAVSGSVYVTITLSGATREGMATFIQETTANRRFFTSAGEDAPVSEDRLRVYARPGAGGPYLYTEISGSDLLVKMYNSDGSYSTTNIAGNIYFISHN